MIYTIAFAECYFGGNWVKCSFLLFSLTATITSIKICIKIHIGKYMMQNNFFLKVREDPFCELKISTTASQVLDLFSVLFAENLLRDGGR